MASGTPDYAPRFITSASADEDLKISVSDADSSSSFSQIVKAILIYNDGPNAVYYNRDAAATTSNFKLPSKAWLMLDVPLTTPHFICATDETATVYCYGVW